MPRQASTPFSDAFRAPSYAEMFRDVPTADLLAELEISRWEALELSDDAPSRSVLQLSIDAIARELERRQRLLAMHRHDPMAPKWPDRDRQMRDRVQAVKDRWPLDIFVSQVLHAQLKPMSGNQFVTHCPLPGHDDSTPSFRGYPDGHAHCFGCGRGGDVIALAGFFFGIERFTEKLELLEAMSGIGRAA